ncbi:MAG TPA: hypothetical protein VF294_16955 [Polyangiaceae bacterium]
MRDEIRDFLRVFGSLSDHLRGRLRRLALGAKHPETEKHHDGYDGDATADQGREALHIEFV